MPRFNKSFFKTASSTNDRFKTNDKPTESMFNKLFDSIPFVKDSGDTAKITEQGLIKLASDANAIDRVSIYPDSMARTIHPGQIPSIRGAVERVYNITDNVIEAPGFTAYDDTKKYRKIFLLESTCFVNGQWKTLNTDTNFDEFQGDGGPAMPVFDVTKIVPADTVVQMRKTYDNKVAIRGFIRLTAAPSTANIDLLSTLIPASYRPLFTTVLTPIDTDKDTWLTIQSSGQISVNRYSGASLTHLEYIRIPELTISLD